ncbi:MAG: class I SAM-dependent methyltransferase [Solirubrobacteraceae bacterium]
MPRSLADIAAGLDTTKGVRRAGGRWPSVAEVYEPYLAPLRGRATSVLEIGVKRGGSMELWAEYFPAARILGVDIKPGLKRFESDRIGIRIGDQGDDAFLDSLIAEAGAFDVVIDDGSHEFADQRSTLLKLWPSVRPGGVYVVEDVHTSYREKYSGGLGREGTFMELAKRFMDDIHFKEHKSETVLADLEALHLHYQSLVLCRWGYHESKRRPPD